MTYQRDGNLSFGELGIGLNVRMIPQAQQIADTKQENITNEWLQYLIDGKTMGVPAIQNRQPRTTFKSAAQQRAVINDGV